MILIILIHIRKIEKNNEKKKRKSGHIIITIQYYAIYLYYYVICVYLFRFLKQNMMQHTYTTYYNLNLPILAA